MKQLTKYGIFTLIYLILNWFVSDEIYCAWQLDSACLFSFFSKYIIFMILMVVYVKWMKNRLTKDKK